MLLARLALSIAWVIPSCSALRFSLAINPAGSSPPVLIRKPVLSLSRLLLSSSLFLRKTRWAMSELTFVLILLKTYSRSSHKRALCSVLTHAPAVASPSHPSCGHTPACAYRFFRACGPHGLCGARH